MSTNNNFVEYSTKGRYKDEFEEIELLGNGSFGRVYKVRNQKEQQLYAMKKINFKAIGFEGVTDQARDDISKEIKIMFDLKSDYVVNCIAYWCENESMHFIQMELCYKALDEVLEQIQIEFNRKPFEKMTTIEYFVSNDLFKELVEALNYLHNRQPQIIHRDLKPQNILITDGKNRRFIKLADFGFSVFHEFRGQSHTQDKGTLKFMAPEVKNSRKYDTRADVYSLGLIAKHLFDIKSADVPQGILLTEKYKNVGNLVEKMTSIDDQKRPNCQQILNSEKLWYLNIRDFRKDQDFENIIDSGVVQSITECFHKYFIHKKIEEYLSLRTLISSEELPKPMDIVEATSKTADTILINKLKDLYLTELKAYSENRPFIERKYLENRNNVYKNEKITTFNRQKRTTNEEIDKELKDLLNNAFTTIYHQIYDENEKRRENILTKAVKIACNTYEDKTSRELGTEFIDNYILDELLRSQKKKTLDIFFKNFEEEDEEVLASHIMNLKEFIENYESTAKSKNKQLIADADKKNSQAVIDAVEAYDSAMQRFLDQDEFISKEQFIEKEKQNKKSAMKLFNNNCKHGNPKFIEKFEFDIEKKLTESKSKFKSIQQTKDSVSECEDIYKKQMNTIFDDEVFYIDEKLRICHNDVEEKVITHFQSQKGGNNELENYLSDLKVRINKNFDEYKELNKWRRDLKGENLELTLSRFLTQYEEKMKDYLKNTSSEQQLIKSHEDVKSEMIKQFQDNCRKEDPIFSKPYLDKFEEKINKLFGGIMSELIDKLI